MKRKLQKKALRGNVWFAEILRSRKEEVKIKSERRRHLGREENQLQFCHEHDNQAVGEK